MRRLLMTSILLISAAQVARAEAPALAPDPGTPHPPENRMDQVVPQMHAPDEAQAMHPPTNRVGEVLPPMKSGDQSQSDLQTGTQTPPEAETNVEGQGTEGLSKD
jgi:hypothetical protein